MTYDKGEFLNAMERSEREKKRLLLRSRALLMAVSKYLPDKRVRRVERLTRDISKQLSGGWND
jgi:hypothetical protein